MRWRVAAAAGSMTLAWLMCPGASVHAGSSAKSRGAELFAVKGCAHCHGTAGVGGNRGPDLQLVRKRMDAAAITLQIKDGGASMPAFGGQLEDAEIKDLVEYLRAKRKLVVVPAKAGESTAPKPGDKDPD